MITPCLQVDQPFMEARTAAAFPWEFYLSLKVFQEETQAHNIVTTTGGDRVIMPDAVILLVSGSLGHLERSVGITAGHSILFSAPKVHIIHFVTGFRCPSDANIDWFRTEMQPSSSVYFFQAM